MNNLIKLQCLIAVFCLCFSSCSKKIEPDSSLIRNNGNEIDSDNQDDFNSQNSDEFSLAGNELINTSDDLLAPRSNALDAFSDPLNTIRPFEPVYFGFDQYNINASERGKLSEIATFIKIIQSKASHRRILRLERNSYLQQILGRSSCHHS